MLRIRNRKETLATGSEQLNNIYYKSNSKCLYLEGKDKITYSLQLLTYQKKIDPYLKYVLFPMFNKSI